MTRAPTTFTTYTACTTYASCTTSTTSPNMACGPTNATAASIGRTRSITSTTATAEQRHRGAQCSEMTPVELGSPVEVVRECCKVT